MSPFVLVLLSNLGAVAIDMPSQQVCEAALRQWQEDARGERIGQCIDRREQPARRR